MHLRAAKIILGFDWNTPAKDVLTKTKYNWKMLKGHFHKAMEQPSTFNCQVWTEGFYNQACFDHSYVQIGKKINSAIVAEANNSGHTCKCQMFWFFSLQDCN